MYRCYYSFIRNYEMKIDTEKAKLTRISRKGKSMNITVNTQNLGTSETI